MAAATYDTRRPSLSERMHVSRSRGAVSGILLVLLGIWGAIIPFIGPIFDYAYTPDDSWHYTTGRLWLEILPGAAAIVAGLILLLSAHRLAGMFAGWLGSAAGAWFVVGQTLSTLWNDGVPQAGVPSSLATTKSAMEQIGFFYGLGAVILFLSAFALGRMTVVGVRDLRRTEPDYDDGQTTRQPYDDNSRGETVRTVPVTGGTTTGGTTTGGTTTGGTTTGDPAAGDIMSPGTTEGRVERPPSS